MARTSIRVYGIEWDTDGISPESLGLPVEVQVPSSVGEDGIADWLSDRYGWCVEGFRVERL